MRASQKSLYRNIEIEQLGVIMEKNIYLHAKRVGDVLLSVGLLFLLSPLFVIIALLIKIQGDGPVIFIQERLGRNSMPFKILKFRSMTLSAPNVSAHELHNKEYVTKLGSFLRKTSLDELPQLINILKGEMSFVGPRPFIPNEGEIVERRKEAHIDMLRPGLTGFAQVMARDTVDQNEKFELDLYYLKHMSFFLDLKIMGLTFFSLKGK